VFDVIAMSIAIRKSKRRPLPQQAWFTGLKVSEL